MAPAVSCGDCGRSLNEGSDLPVEQRQPCPACGSTKRHIAVEITEQLGFNSIVRSELPGEPAVKKVSLNIGRTLALTIVGLVILVLAAWLFVQDKDGPAHAFFALGEAVILGGFGIAYGENRGAKAIT